MASAKAQYATQPPLESVTLVLTHAEADAVYRTIYEARMAGDLSQARKVALQNVLNAFWSIQNKDGANIFDTAHPDLNP